MLQGWLEEYKRENGCKAFQVTAVTLSLGERSSCPEFYCNIRRWAPPDDAPWFMKQRKGSQGTHIHLGTRRQMEEKAE